MDHVPLEIVPCDGASSQPSSLADMGPPPAPMGTARPVTEAGPLFLTVMSVATSSPMAATLWASTAVTCRSE